MFRPVMFKQLGKIPLAQITSALENKKPEGELTEVILPKLKSDNTSLTPKQALSLDAWLDYEHVAAVEAENKRLVDESKKMADESAANARLNEWIAAGLLDNEHNAKAISGFIASSEKLKSLRGKFCVQSVDLAISFLGLKGSNVLQWRPVAPATPAPAAPVVAAPPAAPAPEKLLPNGEPELPLNADEAAMRAASKAQLQDLSRRRGEGQRNNAGRFSSKF